MSGAGDSTVTAWVRLNKPGAEPVRVTVSLDDFIDGARDKVFERMPNSLKGVDGSQVKLCLSDEVRVKSSSPTYIGALEPDKSLRSEVERLNPAWAITDPLYILAVVTGACGGAVGVVWGKGVRCAHPPLLWVFAHPPHFRNGYSLTAQALDRSHS